MLIILSQPENWDTLFTSGHNRSIHRYSVTNPSISYFSTKNHKIMFLESYAEFNYALLLERNVEVVRFQSQPFSINYANNRRYTPDFVEDHGSHLVLVEVKSSNKVLNEKELNKLSIIANLCHEQGAEFSVEFVEHNDPVVKLQRNLHRFHTHDTNFLYKEKPNYKGSIENLLEEMVGNENALCAVYSGIFKGEISIKNPEIPCRKSDISWGVNYDITY